MDEYLMLMAPQKTKTVTVPRIQSMQDYILKHHKRMILGKSTDRLQAVHSGKSKKREEAK